MGTNKKRKLKNLIINWSYQSKYIFWLGITGLGLVVINSGIFYSFTKENYALLVDLSPMTDEAKAQLYHELHKIVTLLTGGSLCFLLVVAMIGLIYSHRTAGPLYHFKKVFKAIDDGNTAARIRLRPKDDFQDVAEAFNQMMDKLERKKN